ncbi:MAG: MFS transporter [Opitutales bacterium]
MEESKPPPESPGPDPRTATGEGDASRGEVAIYAFANIEGAIADKMPETLQNVLIVVAHLNPLLIGLVMGLRTLWDGIMDPIMAYISDNTKTRWGRRRPWVLLGGVSRVLFLVPFIAFLPINEETVADNPVMEAQRRVNDAASVLDKNFTTIAKSFDQLPEADPEVQTKTLDMLEGTLETSWIADVVGVFTPDKDTSFLYVADEQLGYLKENLPKLEEDLATRREILERREAQIADLKAQGVAEDSEEYEVAEGLLEQAEKRVSTSEDLIENGRKAMKHAIAVKWGTTYLLGTYDRIPTGDFPASAEGAQAAAAEEMREYGLEPIDIFEVEPRPAPKPKEVYWPWQDEFIWPWEAGWVAPWSPISDGIEEFMRPANFDQRTLVLYVLIGYLIFATLSTINNAPYYALGIELSPSYEGRTQVVVYRSIANKIIGLVAPWVPVFTFATIFGTAFDALVWVAIAACIIGIPTTVLMFFKTRERTHSTVAETGGKFSFKRSAKNLIRAMWEIAKEPNFLRILFLFVFIGMVNGIFQQIGLFLNIYWVMGSALSGAVLGAQVSMLAWIISFIQLPLIKWACDKFQKHRVMQFGVVWMALGTALKWWLMDPEHPEYQFILPFFFSVGIATIYTVLPTMMADVTDLDELNHGVRREAMFGAVMGFLMKQLGAITPLAGAAVLVASGFNAELEYRQDPQTITNMRLMFSFVPAVMLLGALIVLFKYPLTRERVNEIKGILRERHAKENQESGRAGSPDADRPREKHPDDPDNPDHQA